MTRTLGLLALLVVPALLAADEKKPAFIGVQIARGKDGDGSVVMLVFKDGPADKAGLKPGDVLVKINDIKPADLKTTVEVIRSLKLGKKVKFIVRRDGKEKALDVVPEAAGG